MSTFDRASLDGPRNPGFAHVGDVSMDHQLTPRLAMESMMLQGLDEDLRRVVASLVPIAQELYNYDPEAGNRIYSAITEIGLAKEAMKNDVVTKAAASRDTSRITEFGDYFKTKRPISRF
jgi:hypothetical protein